MPVIPLSLEDEILAGMATIRLMAGTGHLEGRLETLFERELFLSGRIRT